MTSFGGSLLDICIVNWRSHELLRNCLRSVMAQPEVSEIIVVDNASGDGSAEMVQQEFPGVSLIANEHNLGYAAASNQAICASRSPFLLLLNPDTEVQPGALRALLDAFEQDSRVGAAAAQLILPDGSIQSSCRSFPTPLAIFSEALGLSRLFPHSQVFGRYRMTYWDHNSPREVEQPMASALALRRSALDEVGLFDEQFPLYFNDVDLAYRFHQAGWRIWYEPKAKVLHHFGASSTWQVRPSAILESHRGLIRFYRKHYRGRIWWGWYYKVITLAWLTMWPRTGLAWVLKR